jgi:hypothetical protein
MNSKRSLATQSAFRPLHSHVEISATGARLQQWLHPLRSLPLGVFARPKLLAFCPICQFKTAQNTPAKIAVSFEGVTKHRREITTYDECRAWVLHHGVGQNRSPPARQAPAGDSPTDHRYLHAPCPMLPALFPSFPDSHDFSEFAANRPAEQDVLAVSGD